MNPFKTHIAAKLGFISMACLTLSFGADSKQIESLLKSRTGMDFKVISSNAAALQDSEFVVIESPNGERLSAIVSKDGKFVAPLSDGIADANSTSKLKAALESVQQYNKGKKDEAALNLFKKQDKWILKIPQKEGAKAQHTFYMVLDTTCPYCVQEVARLQSYLDEGDVEILIVGILSKKALGRAAGFYAELNKAKSRSEKIALLKRAFEASYSNTGNASSEGTAKMLSNATLEAGIQAVPFIVVK